ncbi:ATP-binding protein [Kitasatospora purpeofusca]|uniref:ATP-binding protein n=1 Tax=Kitasatospora purpeofusca TaxID=67352 RepID=UPI00381D9737
MNRTTVGGPELGGGRGAGSVVVLSDPAAGAGSGAVAPLVADALFPSVHLRAEDFRRAVRQGYVAPDLPEARRQNVTALAATAQAAFAFASGGYQVVVEGSVAPTALDAFRRESRATGAALHYVVLNGGTTGGTAAGSAGADGAQQAEGRAAADAAEATADTVLAGLRRGAYLLGW